MQKWSRRTLRILFIVVLASLALSLFAGCSSDSGQPSGWTRYRDSKYPFQVSFPSGWHVGTFTDKPTDAPERYYVVKFVPPNSSATPSATAMNNGSEGVYISINDLPYDSCADSDVGPYTAKYPDSLTISGKKVTRYDRQLGREATRFAWTTFGDHCYAFTEVSLSATADQNLDIFLRMLQTFAYTGASSGN